uniref:Uncharacterized protein n=1 Tax=Knipowitschia caucasica TaxID=637954 RepID=A0AAV2JN18_KNICA
MSRLGKNDYTYPDLLTLFIVLLVTAFIALGVRNSVGFNNVLNVVNLVVWVFMIIAGLFFISACNWEGGNFLPYGCYHVTVGEFVAFFIGWNLILEYLIGTTVGASALSSMFDSLANHTISHYMITHLGTLRGLGKAHL